MKITYIGLGIMGSRMAKNLALAGHTLTVYNRTAAPALELEKLGAIRSDSISKAVKDADIVFTMLSTPEVVQAVMLDKDTGIHHMKENSLWVDCTTVNPSFSEGAALLAQDKGIRFLDAPVAGTKPQAERAELVFFIGGETADLETASPYLKHMGQKQIHIGGTGKGASFKMLVNALLAQSMLAFSETLVLGEKMGLDKEFMLNTLPKLPVTAPFTQFKADMIRNDKFDVQFPLEWMHKDLQLAALCAYEQGQALPMTNLAKEIYAQAKQQGLGREDFAAVHKVLAG